MSGNNEESSDKTCLHHLFYVALIVRDWSSAVCSVQRSVSSVQRTSECPGASLSKCLCLQSAPETASNNKWNEIS